MTLRSVLVDVLSDLADRDVAVAVSGGVDSSSLVLSLLDAGARPTVVSFTLDDRSSSDYQAALRLAAGLRLPFVESRLSTARADIVDGVRRLVLEYGATRKTEVECLWPFLAVLETLRGLRLDVLVTGSAADGHFALSKRAMIHFRYPVETFQAFRRDYFAKPDPAQTKTLARIGLDYGVDVRAPYTDPRVFELFVGRTWDDLNRPRQKEAIRSEFPELEPFRIRNHTNLQLGDSGIADTVGAAAIATFAPGARSSVAAYNRIRKEGSL